MHYFNLEPYGASGSTPPTAGGLRAVRGTTTWILWMQGVGLNECLLQKKNEMDLGNHQQGKKYYEGALTIKLNKLGPDHVAVARTYHNMGNLHMDLGDHQQAKEYYERALSIKLNKLGPDHVDVASTYHNMAILHKKLGEHQKAKDYYGRALSIQVNKLAWTRPCWRREYVP